MGVRKIRLVDVDFDTHKKGDMITVGKDISKGAADYLVKTGNAAETEESKLPEDEKKTNSSSNEGGGK
jgi:hypothetical protein